MCDEPSVKIGSGGEGENMGFARTPTAYEGNNALWGDVAFSRRSFAHVREILS